MDMAVRNNPKGRYYRNWGLTYQHSGEFEKAKECYLTAFNGNPKDYKAYNNLLALTLRIVDSKLEIEERYKTENGKLLSEFCNASEKIDNTLVADLEWTNEYREFAEKGNFWFEDIHYNICKMYMYFYILSDYKEEEYIRQAIKFCEKALVINQSSLGAKFCLRNAYEAAGDIAKAIEINDQLKIANNGKPVGDSVEIGEMYERRK